MKTDVNILQCDILEILRIQMTYVISKQITWGKFENSNDLCDILKISTWNFVSDIFKIIIYISIIQYIYIPEISGKDTNGQIGSKSNAI